MHVRLDFSFRQGYSVNSLGTLNNFHGRDYFGGHDGDVMMQDIYSKKWGWVDLSHLAVAAYQTDHFYLTKGDGLLNMENHENKDYRTNPSAFNYEDLVSNLIGVHFETYLESSQAKGKDFITNLTEYLTELGFVDNVYEAPNIATTPETHHNKTDNPKNHTYTPMYVTEKRDGKLDKEIIDLKNTFLELMKFFGCRGEDRRTEENKTNNEICFVFAKSIAI